MDKNSRAQMLRKLAQMVENEDVDDALSNECDIIHELLTNYEQIDKEMIAKLNDIFSGDLKKKNTYLSVINSINEGSTVVYFKSAQLFKVYKKEESSAINEQLKDIFIDYDDIYQLISKKHMQKIAIETDLTLLPNVEVFIKYVVKFMIKLGFIDFNETNIDYIETKSLVFTINGYYVKNSKEKQRFIEKLIKFIYKQYDYDKIVNTIKTYNHCEFDKCEQFEIISLINSLTDIKNCKYIFEPKQIQTETVTNHHNVYIFTDHDWQQQLKKNFKRDSKWVYFIQDGAGVKIGMTKNLKDRKSALQTGNSHKLQIIAYIESETMAELEKTFHTYLKPLSITGEWFKLDKEKTVKMLQGCRNGNLSYEF